LGLGILSNFEYVAKIPINEGLINPEYPVWILHGGDHFTVLFCKEHPNVQEEKVFKM